MSWIDELEKTFGGEGLYPSPPPKQPHSWWLKFLSAVATFLRRRERRRDNMLIYNPDNRSEATIVKEKESLEDTQEITEEKHQLPIPATKLEWKVLPREVALPRRSELPRWNVWSLYVAAISFLGLAVAINVWNAWGSNLSNTAIPLAMGIVAELALFVTIPCIRVRPILAVLTCAAFFGFALWNDLRMASIIAADAELARADRQTVGTDRASDAVTKAQADAIKACGPGLGKSKGCALAQDNTVKAEKAAKDARAEVKALAHPEAKDFVRFVAWITRGAVVPSADDFDMWGLLFRMVIPNLGGLVLLLARR